MPGQEISRVLPAGLGKTRIPLVFLGTIAGTSKKAQEKHQYINYIFHKIVMSFNEQYYIAVVPIQLSLIDLI
jgi:hypothetical protein